MPAVLFLRVSNTSSCEDDNNDGDDDEAQRSRMKTPAQTNQRRNGGENGTAVISGHQHVADVPLTAGRAHLRDERKAYHVKVEETSEGRALHVPGSQYRQRQHSQ